MVKRCRINGWCPLLVGVPQALPVLMNLETVRNYYGGGTAKIHFSLEGLYRAHLKHWNKWSTSNDGTDLCRYLGTKITFLPHSTHSYIVNWDREYKTEDRYPNYINHPFIMLLGRQRVVVKSIAHRGGVGKAKRVFIPPPALNSNEWFFQKDFSNYGLFQLRASLFEPNEHFMSFSATSYGLDLDLTASKCVYDVFHDTGTGNQISFAIPKGSSENEPGQDAVEWGKDYPYWMSFWGMNVEGIAQQHPTKKFFIKWFQCQNNAPNFQLPKVWRKITTEQAKDLSLMGPGVPKEPSHNWSIIFKYTSYWHWGGHTPDSTRGVEFDPSGTPGPQRSVQHPGVPVRDPEEAGEGVIHPWDLRRGIITKKAWQRITGEKPPEGHDIIFTESKEGAVGHPGGPRETELWPSESSEQESSSASEWEMEEEPSQARKRKHKRRDDRLLRKLAKLFQ